MEENKLTLSDMEIEYDSLEYEESEETENKILNTATEDFSTVVYSGANIATENEWLDDNTKANEENEEANQNEDTEETGNNENEEKSNEDNKIKKFFTRKRIISISAAAVVVLLIIGLFTIGGINANEWWNDVKLSTMNVFGIETPENKMTLSATMDIDTINNGDIVVKGGALALSMTDGTVLTVTDNSVSVQYDKDTIIIYSNLYDIDAVAGQELSGYDIIGRYNEMYVVNIMYKNNKVVNVAKINRSIVWEV